MVLKEDLCFGGGQLCLPTGRGGSGQSVGVTDSPGRVTLKVLVFGHFVIHAADIFAIHKDLLWAGQGTSNIQAMSAQTHCLFFFFPSLTSI